MIAKHPIKMNGAEPDCDQGQVHGFPVSWNPDDDSFYLHGDDPEDPHEVLAVYSRKSPRAWGNIKGRALTLRQKRNAAGGGK